LGYDTHSQIVLPESQLFVNHNNGDFHLLPFSQPLNIGTSLVSSVVTIDADGIARPQGSGYDIGAYEFLSPTIAEEETLPQKFILYQNYPNPFNPSTTIQYTIDSKQFVTLNVYDILGNVVAALVNGEQAAGNYEIEFNTSSTNHHPSSGVYFYRLEAGNFIGIKKMLLLK